MKNTFLAVVSALLFVGCTHVDGGYVGVEVSQCGGGGIKEQPVGVGYHWTGPCTTIVEFPTFQQTSSFKDAEALSLRDKLGMTVRADVVLNYQVEATAAPRIYAQFRQDLTSLEDTYLRQVIYEAMKDVYEGYSAAELYSGKQEQTRAEVQSLLIEKLKPAGFVVTQFTVNKVLVPEEVENNIKQKSAMIEATQTAELKVKQAEAEAKQRVVAAQADADAVRLRADADAYRNRVLAQSISPTLVEYIRANKWNGQMATITTVSGGATVVSNTPESSSNK